MTPVRRFLMGLVAIIVCGVVGSIVGTTCDVWWYEMQTATFGEQICIGFMMGVLAGVLGPPGWMMCSADI